MAISRSLMNRQLRADGGIMQVAPREKFGLGSSIKKFVRKIIPNEVSEIAVKAAPFVAPFNPAVAAAMSGIKLKTYAKAHKELAVSLKKWKEA